MPSPPARRCRAAPPFPRAHAGCGSGLLVFWIREGVYGSQWIGLALGLHAYWFYSWIVSQRKKGVIKELEDRYAHQINRIKSHGRAARNFILRPRLNHAKRTG